jgi:hypothetical protein
MLRNIVPLVVDVVAACISAEDILPPVVATEVIAPLEVNTTPVGLGFAIVVCGTIAIAPLWLSVLITAPPKSIV